MRTLALVAALLLAEGGAACAAEHGDTLCVLKLQLGPTCTCWKLPVVAEPGRPPRAMASLQIPHPSPPAMAHALHRPSSPLLLPTTTTTRKPRAGQQLHRTHSWRN